MPIRKKYKFCDFVNINPLVKLKANESYSFIEMKDLNDGQRFAYPSVKRTLTGGARFEENDTLFARITPCLENGKICQAKGLKDKKGFGSTEFLIFRGKKDVSDSDFVFYLSRWDDVRRFAELNMVGTSGRQRVPKDVFENLELDLPEDIPTQTRIASILSALDDKIELNRRTNQTLEAMAQTLFKKYFVTDIDPDNLPDYLEPKQLGDIADIIDCLHSKKPEIDESHTGNIFLQLENLLDNGLLDMSKVFSISNEDYKKWISRIEVQFGDCVITNVGRSGVAARIPKGLKAAMGRNMTAIRLKKDFNYPAFLIILLTSDYMKREIESNLDVGTILNALNVRSIPKLKFLFPKSFGLISEIENKLAPLFMLMEENLNEINSLIKIRDSLLPKLMSGEIEVN